MDGSLNRIHHGDCVAGMKSLPAGSVDLAFADPPFNIGYDYDVYDDRKESDHYLSWSREWISALHRALKPTGTFWLAIGDEYAAELKVISQEIGFHCRSWVIWYYTFGVNCKQKFSRSHAHLFHFVKDRAEFTFLCDELENRIPSARQLVYNDTRANPYGRLPDDTWILRPQDLADCFTPGEDTWYFPRVAGTFKERAGFHGCQMPEQLLGRIIRLCSRREELVLDPFSGSATTLAVARKLGRQYVGFDLSEDYVARGAQRLSEIQVGDALVGAAEPTVSAPTTPADALERIRVGKKSMGRKPTQAAVALPVRDLAEGDATRADFESLIGAYEAVHDGYSLDRVVADKQLCDALAQECRRRGIPGEPKTWNRALFALRKTGRLAHIPTTRRTELSWKQLDRFRFASEISWQRMRERGRGSLDDILGDPASAAEFDALGLRLCPGSTSLELRWGALKLRKQGHVLRNRPGMDHAAMLPPDQVVALNDLIGGSFDADRFPAANGVYVVKAGKRRTPVYVGETMSLREFSRQAFGSADQVALWMELVKSKVDLTLETVTPEGHDPRALAYQNMYCREHRPQLNCEFIVAS